MSSIVNFCTPSIFCEDDINSVTGTALSSSLVVQAFSLNGKVSFSVGVVNGAQIIYQGVQTEESFLNYSIIKIKKINSTKFIVVWQDSSTKNIKFAIGTVNISNYSISFGEVATQTEVSGDVVELNLEVLSESLFTCVISTAFPSVHKNVCGIISGTSIMLGTCYNLPGNPSIPNIVRLTDTSYVLVGARFDSDYSYSGKVVTVSGTTPTYGDKQEIYEFGSSFIYSYSSIDLIPLSSSKFIAVLPLPISGNLLKVAICSVSGSTISTGNIYTPYMSGSISSIGGASLVDNNYFIIFNYANSSSGKGYEVCRINETSISFVDSGDYSGAPRKVNYLSNGSIAITTASTGCVVSVSVTPAVTTQSADQITITGFRGNGNITEVGTASVTRRGFCYKVGTSGDPTTSDSVAYDDGDFGTGAFTKSITGLSPNTSYRVRAYAVNSAGTSYGDTVDVKTLISAKIKGLSTIKGLNKIII